MPLKKMIVTDLGRKVRNAQEAGAHEKLLKFRTYPEKRNIFLTFNRFKFNVIAGYNGCASTESSCNENGVSKRHRKGCFEPSCFTYDITGNLMQNINRRRIQIFQKGIGILTSFDVDAVIVYFKSLNTGYEYTIRTVFCLSE